MDTIDIHKLRRMIAVLRRQAQSATTQEEVDDCLIHADMLQRELNSLAGKLTVTGGKLIFELDFAWKQ